MAIEFDLGLTDMLTSGTKKKQKPKNGKSALATAKPKDVVKDVFQQTGVQGDPYAGTEEFMQQTMEEKEEARQKEIRDKKAADAATLESAGKVRGEKRTDILGLVKGAGGELVKATDPGSQVQQSQAARNRAYVQGLRAASPADFDPGQDVPMFLDAATNQYIPVRYQDWKPEMGKMNFAKFTDVFKAGPGGDQATAPGIVTESGIIRQQDPIYSSATQLKPELEGEKLLQDIDPQKGEEEALGIYKGDPEAVTYKDLNIIPPEGVSEYSVPTDMQKLSDLAREQDVYEDVKTAFAVGDITIIDGLTDKQLTEMKVDLYTASPEYAASIKKAFDNTNLEEQGFTTEGAKAASASLSDFAAGNITAEEFDLSSIITMIDVFDEDEDSPTYGKLLYQSLSPASTSMIELYHNIKSARASDKYQESKADLDEISVLGQATPEGKKSLAMKQWEQETSDMLARLYGRPMTQESLDEVMKNWANMSDEEKEEFRTVELRNLEEAVDQFGQQLTKEYAALELSVAEFQSQESGYVMEYTEPEYAADGVTVIKEGGFVIAEEEVTETITNEDGTTSEVTKKVPMKTVDRKKTEQDIIESQERIKDAEKNQTFARDELQFRVMATDEDNFQRQQERLSREYITEITLKGEKSTALALAGKGYEAEQSMQEQGEFATKALQTQSESHEAQMQTQAEAFGRERMRSEEKIAALNAAVDLERQQNQQSSEALQVSSTLLMNIMSNPYGYFAMQQLGGIEGLMGGGTGQAGVVPGLAGLEGLGYQKPDATAGQALAPSEFFGGSIPTLGALQGVSEPTLNLLTSLLQFTGTTPEAFSQKAAGVTPAAQRMYQMPTFAPTGEPAYRGRGPSASGERRIGESYAGSTGADILAGRAGQPLGGRI